MSQKMGLQPHKVELKLRQILRRRGSYIESDVPCSSGISYFNSSSLVKTGEGTFKPPTQMEKNLNKHLKSCLPKEEREALRAPKARSSLQHTI